MRKPDYNAPVIYDAYGRPVDARSTAVSTSVGMTLPALGRKRTAGVYVDEMRALACDVVWRCVTLISGTMKQLPVEIRTKTGTGSVEVPGPETDLVRGNANEEMTFRKFTEVMQMWYDTWGNAYAEIERSRNGNRVVALWPVAPDRVEMKRDARGRLVYDIRNDGGSNTPLYAHEVFHLKWLSYDGLQGFNVIRMAQRAIGLALAHEVYAAGWFGNGAQPRGALKFPEELDDDQFNDYRKKWDDIYGGPENTGKIGILDGGMEYVDIGQNPAESQLTEGRGFQVGSVGARYFGVPPAFLGDMSHATMDNFEQMMLMFGKHSVLPRGGDWENEYKAKVLGFDSPLYFRLNLNGLLRGDTKSRTAMYQMMRQWGVYTVDDILSFEDMDPIGGDAGALRLVPGNYQSIERAAKGLVMGVAGKADARDNTDVDADVKTGPDDDDDEEKKPGDKPKARTAATDRTDTTDRTDGGTIDSKAIVTALGTCASRWGRKHSKAIGRIVGKVKADRLKPELQTGIDAARVDAMAIEARRLVLEDRETMEAELSTLATSIASALLTARGSGLADNARRLIEKSIICAATDYAKRCGDTASRVVRGETDAAIEEIEILDAGQLAEDCAAAVGTVLELTA